MAEFTFKWPAGPKNVTITGDFDDWKGSMPLVKSPKGDFSLTMPIEQTSTDKFNFKFIVDGEWMTSDSYKREISSDGNENNCIVISSLPSYGSKTVGGAKIPEIGIDLVAPEVAAPVLGNQGPQKAQPAPGSKGKKGKKKKVQVKRRIRKNKKTGEKTVISEERFEIKSGAEDEYETEETATATGTSREETPLSSAAVPVSENDPSTTVMPSTENKQTTIGEPGVVIVPNPTEIPEFSQVRDVDANELNERLNREMKEKEDAAATAAAAAAAAAPAAADIVEKSTTVTKSATEESVEPLVTKESAPVIVPGSITTATESVGLQGQEAPQYETVPPTDSAVVPVVSDEKAVVVQDLTPAKVDTPAIVTPPAIEDATDVEKELPIDAKTNATVLDAPVEPLGESSSEPKTSKSSAPVIIEEVGQITSPEQEEELIRKTLDPKSPGIEELLIVEGNIPASKVAEIQAASDKAADQAIANGTPEVTVATEGEILKEIEKPTEPTTTAKPESKPVSATKAKKAAPGSKPDEKKKKKKGFFSKLKKIFN